MFRGDELKDLTVMEVQDEEDELEQNRNPHDGLGQEKDNPHWDNVWSTPPNDNNPWRSHVPHSLNSSLSASNMNDTDYSYCYGNGVSTASVPYIDNDRHPAFMEDDPFLRREREEEAELRRLEEEKNSNKVSGTSSTTATYSYGSPTPHTQNSDRRTQDWSLTVGSSSMYGSDTYSGLNTRNNSITTQQQQQQPYSTPDTGFVSAQKSNLSQHSSPTTQETGVVPGRTFDRRARKEEEPIGGNNALQAQNSAITLPSLWNSEFRDKTTLAGSGAAEGSWQVNAGAGEGMARPAGELSAHSGNNTSDRKSWGEYKPFGEPGDWRNQTKWEARNRNWRDTWEDNTAPLEAKEEPKPLPKPKPEPKNERNNEKRWERDEQKTQTKDEKRQNPKEEKKKELEAPAEKREAKEYISGEDVKNKNGIEQQQQQRKNGTDNEPKEQRKNGTKDNTRGGARRFNSLNDVFNHHRGSEAIILEQLCSHGTPGWSSRRLRALSEQSPVVYHVYLDFVNFCCGREVNMDDETSWSKFSDATKKNFESLYKEAQDKEFPPVSAVSSSAVSSKATGTASSAAHEEFHSVTASANKMYGESPSVHEATPNHCPTGFTSNQTRKGPTLGDFAPVKAKEPKKKAIKEKAAPPVREKTTPGNGKKVPMKKLSLTAPTPGVPTFNTRTTSQVATGWTGMGVQKQAPVKEKLKLEDGSWNCPRCTLLNESFLLECAACACPLEHASTLSEFPPLGS